MRHTPRRFFVGSSRCVKQQLRTFCKILVRVACCITIWKIGVIVLSAVPSIMKLCHPVRTHLCDPDVHYMMSKLVNKDVFVDVSIFWRMQQMTFEDCGYRKRIGGTATVGAVPIGVWIVSEEGEAGYFSELFLDANDDDGGPQFPQIVRLLRRNHRLDDMFRPFMSELIDLIVRGNEKGIVSVCSLGVRCHERGQRRVGRFCCWGIHLAGGRRWSRRCRQSILPSS